MIDAESAQSTLHQCIWTTYMPSTLNVCQCCVFMFIKLESSKLNHIRVFGERHHYDAYSHQASTLSNSQHTIHWLTRYPITVVWVTRPERPKSAKDEVERPKGPPVRSRGPKAPRLLVPNICQSFYTPMQMVAWKKCAKKGRKLRQNCFVTKKKNVL